MTGPSQQPPEPIDAEIVPDAEPPTAPDADYDEHGVPSLDFVRNKIEGRHATALGSAELSQGTPQAHSLEQQEAERQRAAKDRLEEIRRSLNG